MKKSITSLALGTIIISSITGCSKSEQASTDANNATSPAVAAEHTHSENCEHATKETGHTHGPDCDHAGPGKETAKAIADKLAFLPEVLAEVDGKQITRAEYEKMLQDSIPPTQLVGFMSAKQDQIKAHAVNFAKSQVEQTIMINLAAKAGFKPSPERVIKNFEEFYNSQSAEEQKKFVEGLKEGGKTLEGYKKEVSGNTKRQEHLTITAWLDEKVFPAAAVTEEDIKAAYEVEKAEKYVEKEQIKVAHIPFKHDNTPANKKAAEEKANTVLRQIRSGADFEQMVRENPSSDGHLKRLGVLDFFSAGTYNGKFEDAAFALKVGEVSNLIDTPDGYQLIKLIARKPGKVTPLNEVKDDIRQRLSEMKRGQAISKLLDEGKKQYKAEIKISIK